MGHPDTATLEQGIKFEGGHKIPLDLTFGDMYTFNIDDAIWRNTAAPSVCGLGVFKIRVGMWRLAVYAWC